MDLLKRLASLDVVAVVLSLTSLLIAWRAYVLSNARFEIDLQEHWVEKFSQEFKSVLPSNNIPQAAGLRIARLADSMPVKLHNKRREVIEHGYFRAIPGGGFDAFWEHLCEIQDWPRS